MIQGAFPVKDIKKLLVAISESMKELQSQGINEKFICAFSMGLAEPLENLSSSAVLSFVDKVTSAVSKFDEESVFKFSIAIPVFSETEASFQKLVETKMRAGSQLIKAPGLIKP